MTKVNDEFEHNSYYDVYYTTQEEINKIPKELFITTAKGYEFVMCANKKEIQLLKDFGIKDKDLPGDYIALIYNPLDYKFIDLDSDNSYRFMDDKTIKIKQVKYDLHNNAKSGFVVGEEVIADWSRDQIGKCRKGIITSIINVTDVFDCDGERTFEITIEPFNKKIS